jgi:steroid delta-isomerase-like uncharacterized protein
MPSPVERGHELAAKYVRCTEHVNASRWEQFESDCLAAGFVSHVMDDRDLRGPDALVQSLQDMKTAFPDWKIEPQLVLVNGRDIFAIVLSTGTHRGTLKTPVGELPATHRRLGQLFFHRIAFDDQYKATEEWAYTDFATMLGQLGKLSDDAHPTRAAIPRGMGGEPRILVATDDTQERANLALVKRWSARFSAHDVPGVMALYADDAVESDHAIGADLRGKQQIEDFTIDFLNAFPDGTIELSTLVAAGEYVVALGTFTGTHGAALGNMPKTGRPLRFSYAEVVKVEDGKLGQVWRFRSSLAMAKQLGTMPEPEMPEQTRQP